MFFITKAECHGPICLRKTIEKRASVITPSVHRFDNFHAKF